MSSSTRLKGILKAIGCTNLLPKLEAELIDDESLAYLTVADLSKVIPMGAAGKIIKIFNNGKKKDIKAPHTSSPLTESQVLTELDQNSLNDSQLEDELSSLSGISPIGCRSGEKRVHLGSPQTPKKSPRKQSSPKKRLTYENNIEVSGDLSLPSKTSVKNNNGDKEVNSSSASEPKVKSSVQKVSLDESNPMEALTNKPASDETDVVPSDLAHHSSLSSATCVELLQNPQSDSNLSVASLPPDESEMVSFDSSPRPSCSSAAPGQHLQVSSSKKSCAPNPEASKNGLSLKEVNSLSTCQPQPTDDAVSTLQKILQGKSNVSKVSAGRSALNRNALVLPTGTASKSRLLITSAEALQELLNSSLQGKSILSNNRTVLLTDAQSFSLCDIIVRYEFQNDPDRSIGKQEFMILRSVIVELFPKEIPDIYYTPGAGSGKSRVTARGRLLNKYEFIKKQFITNNLRPSKRPKKSSNGSDDQEAKKVVSEEAAGLISKYISWLEVDKSPKHILDLYWESTFEHRWAEISDRGSGKIGSYFKKYRALQDSTLCIELLSKDFSLKYPDNKDNLFKIWSETAVKLLNTVKINCKSSQKWRENVQLSGIDLHTSDPEEIKLAALLLLPYFFPLPGDINLGTKKDSWHPTKPEVANGFVLTVASEGYLELELSRRQRFMQKKGLTCQPLTVLIGDAESSLEAFVVIDEYRFRFDSPLVAFDWCFKAYHSLNLEYPPECCKAYAFIQKWIYKITTSYDRNFMPVTKLAQSLSLV